MILLGLIYHEKKKRCLRTIYENRTTADELRIEEIRFRGLFSFLLAYSSLNFSRLNSLNELKNCHLFIIFLCSEGKVHILDFQAGHVRLAKS